MYSSPEQPLHGEPPLTLTQVMGHAAGHRYPNQTLLGGRCGYPNAAAAQGLHTYGGKIIINRVHNAAFTHHNLSHTSPLRQNAILN